MKKFWLPYSLWDIQGIELWLNEMAAKGYELKRFSRFWSIGRVEFQPSEEAKHCRYRLEPIGKGTKELRERAANYRELGWRFVEQIGKLYAVYRCDDPEAPELYTDPESLGWAMKKLIRRQWLAAAAVLLWAGLLLRDMLAQLFTAPAVLAMELVLDFELLAPLLLALLVVVGGTVLGVLYQTVRFTGLRRRLAQGGAAPGAEADLSPAAAISADPVPGGLSGGVLLLFQLGQQLAGAASAGESGRVGFPPHHPLGDGARRDGAEGERPSNGDAP